MRSQDIDFPEKSYLDLSQTQRERLAYIDFRLYFLGDVGRQDLIGRFGIAPAGATRDLAQYRKLFPENAQLDGTSKRYVISTSFRPAFEHNSNRALTVLAHGFGDGLATSDGPLIPCESPLLLSRPQPHILAPVTRAIHQSAVIKLEYYSHTSGASTREIVPFAIVDDGLRWHVRAFDRKEEEFRDFVLTRMIRTEIVEGAKVARKELPTADDQWTRIVELELIPHPLRGRAKLIERDFGMSDGVLRVRVRAAIAGYFLRHWIVDCSPGHKLKGEEYRLCLKNPLSLYGVSNAILAPGYSSPQTMASKRKRKLPIMTDAH